MYKPIRKEGKIGYFSVVAIGIGGMVGGGIFAVLGLAVKLGSGGTPVAFALAGLVALITSYSYARLSVKYPSEGGTVEFLNQGFGTGIFAGSLNVLLWISYLIMLSLYAYAFGGYASSFFPEATQVFWRHIFLSGAIIFFTLLNAMGSLFVGKAEEWIVGIKLLILLFFIGVGFWSIDAQRIQVSNWAAPISLIAGGMIIFVAYEGFELIANTAKDVKNAFKTLPKAYFSAVGFVIILYILISLVTIGNLPVSKIVDAKDYALAAAAKPFLGHFGFILIAIAAILSTGSALNATLYGVTRVSYIIAKDGELPRELDRKVWNKHIEGLFISCVLSLLIANLFDLSSIATMGSAGFLLIFAAVNASNFRLYKKTAAKRWIAGIGVIVCLVALGALIYQTLSTAPKRIWVLLAMAFIAVLIEVVYRMITGRHIKISGKQKG